MDRLFKRSNSAKWFKLDKMWDFCIDPSDLGCSERWYESFPEEHEKMCVPSCWNTTLGYFGYVGVAWYKTDFEISEESVYLKFEGVANECDVYLDKKFIGHHYGAFLEFGFEALDIGKGNHELVLRVDNTANLCDTIPHKNTDWYNYGGINRGVEVREIGDIYIKDSRISYELDGDCATLSVKTKINAKSSITDTLEVCVNGESVYSSEITARGDCEQICSGIKLCGIKLWDMKEPNLYYVTVRFAGEDLTERIGFRKIECSGKDILLNGKKLFITGVCRHEEHPDWGLSMPFELIKRDIDIISDMNCNCIRGSHYPNSKKTLDYLDERGILFWEEIPLWGNRPEWAESFKNPEFINRATTMHKEMVLRDINHPCIVFWGLHNEVDTSLPQTREFSKRIIEEIRKQDTSRLLTYASNIGAKDECMDLVDVIGFNKYIGWYSSVEEESIERFIESVKEKLEKSCGPKPIVLSEFGGAAIKGCTSLEPMRWSENYQSRLLSEHIEICHKSGEIAGTFIWQFCDANTQNELCFTRPRGFNNKGILNEYRQPKLAYETVRDIYGKYNPKASKEREFKMY